MRRDEVVWLRETLSEAGTILRTRQDVGTRYRLAREKIGWLTRQYMPTKGATKVLTALKAELQRLDATPPTKAADLGHLHQTVQDLVGVIDECLRFW
jgi:hypothetical protein